MKTTKRIIKLLAAWFILHVAFLFYDGLSTTNAKADIGVILGNKVNEDGTVSNRLKARLDEGIRLYKNNQISQLLVSGGLGKEGFYEGDKMKDYLVKNNIPSNKIYVDNLGNNTYATAVNTAKLKDSIHFKSVMVISQYFHVTRTKLLFKKAGLNIVNSSAPTYFEWRDTYGICREFAGFYWGLIIY